MDFSNYKDATISRQIMRRMAAMQIPSLEAYGDYIGKRRQELNELASNFLICVTSFFRDPESFDALRKELRELLKSKRPGDDIRFWMPGCATGEEVYSLAILLAEELGDQRDKYRIQLFATDINGEAVSMARAGLYPEAALSGIDSALIARYFTVQDGMYLVDKSLRDMTLFARQDLVQDPPFVRLANILVWSTNADDARDYIGRIAKLLKRRWHAAAPDFLRSGSAVPQVLGPASCVIERAKDRYRFHLLVKSPVGYHVSDDIDACLKDVGSVRGVSVSVDVDAYDLM